MTVDRSVTLAILEDIQDRIVELFESYGTAGLHEEGVQGEIKEMIHEWFDGSSERDDVPEWLIDNHSDDITRVALECLKVEINFDVTPTLVKSVEQLQGRLNQRDPLPYNSGE